MPAGSLKLVPTRLHEHFIAKMIKLDAVDFLVDYDGFLLDLCGDTCKSGLPFEGFK